MSEPFDSDHPDHPHYGQRLLHSSGGAQFNAHSFLVGQAMGRVRTHVLVKVMKVHGGGVGAPPTIDVQILTKQQDGLSNTTSHGTIYGVQVKRNQGSSFAIINDPVEGDVGEMAIHDRDISSAVAAMKEATPGSRRMFHLSDSVYYGQVGNQTKPTQYVNFRSDGVDIVDNQKNKITTSSKGINLNGVVIDAKGNVTAPGEVTAMQSGSSVALSTHLHDGVTPGAGKTQKPVAGT